MKKILLTIITGLVLLGTSTFCYAADTKPPLYNATFDVGKALSLCKEYDDEGKCTDTDQGQTYFKKDSAVDEGRSPIVQLIVYVIEFVTKIIGSISMILVIIGGFVLIVSQGNQQTIDKGKEIIKYAFFGLAITFGAYTIAVFIQSIFYAS